jgi:hypothetical protein
VRASAKSTTAHSSTQVCTSCESLYISGLTATAAAVPHKRALINLQQQYQRCWQRNSVLHVSSLGEQYVAQTHCKFYTHTPTQNCVTITEPGARSALLSHAHRCNTSLETMLTAYSNSTEVSLDSNDSTAITETTGQWPFGTRIAKQFDEEWFEGKLKQCCVAEDFYWVLYSDGDSEK